MLYIVLCMRTKVIVSAALIVLSIALVNTQTASARRDAFMDGRIQANADFRAGANYDDSCSIDLSHGYCIAYKIGYSMEWNALRFLH